MKSCRIDVICDKLAGLLYGFLKSPLAQKS